jgi:hypothetical protein
LRVVGVHPAGGGAGNFEIFGEAFVEPEGDGGEARVEDAVGVLVAEVFLDAVAPVGVDGELVFGSDEVGAARGEAGMDLFEVAAVGVFVREEVDDDVVPGRGEPQRRDDVLAEVDEVGDERVLLRQLEVADEEEVVGADGVLGRLRDFATTCAWGFSTVRQPTRRTARRIAAAARRSTRVTGSGIVRGRSPGGCGAESDACGRP